jgi:hypothetical protein
MRQKWQVPENSLGRQATIGSDHHDGTAPSVLEKPTESDLPRGVSPTLSETLHDCGELKHVLGDFRYGKLLKLGRGGGIFDTDLVEQFAYKLR